MTKAAVQLSNVTKQFGDVIALKGIDLAIVDGEFFSLLGPSGCGKTTTLRLRRSLPTTTRMPLVKLKRC